MVRFCEDGYSIDNIFVLVYFCLKFGIIYLNMPKKLCQHAKKLRTCMSNCFIDIQVTNLYKESEFKIYFMTVYKYSKTRL